MVHRSTIRKRRNEAWVLPVGLARYQAVLLFDEDGHVGFEYPGERPPPGTGACYHCGRYTYEARRLCQYAHCTELYCTECGRYTWGMGLAECPCDESKKGSGGFGHKTKDEQPRQPVRRKGVPRTHQA